MSPRWVSIRFAGQAAGRSHVVIHKAITDGRIPPEAVRRGKGGRVSSVDLRAVKAAFEENSDPGQDLAGGKATGRPKRYMDARTEREEFQARLAEIALQEKLGTVVNVAAVRNEIFKVWRNFRDRIVDALPSRVAPMLASLTDPRAIESLLRTEARQAMAELSRMYAEQADSIKNDRSARDRVAVRRRSNRTRS
jgi:hypothetical protein